MRKLLALTLAVLGPLGLSVVLARPPLQDAAAPVADPAEETARPLQTDVRAVRLQLGVTDTSSQSWSGRFAVAPGEVVDVLPDRLRENNDGRVTGPDSWDTRSLLVRRANSKKAKNARPLIVPASVIVRFKAPAEATLTVTTEQGEARVPLADLAGGAARSSGSTAGSSARPSRTTPRWPPARSSRTYPAAAADGKAGAWVAYVAHQPRRRRGSEAVSERPEELPELHPQGRRRPGQAPPLRRRQGRSTPIDVTDAGRDVWRPDRGRRQQRQGRTSSGPRSADGNWDLYTRDFDSGRKAWARARPADDRPRHRRRRRAADRPATGTVWIAWQAWRDGQADILLAPLDQLRAGRQRQRRPGQRVDAVAHRRRRRLGHPARRLRQLPQRQLRRVPGDRPAPAASPSSLAVADSTRFEARPSLARRRPGPRLGRLRGTRSRTGARTSANPRPRPAPASTATAACGSAASTAGRGPRRRRPGRRAVGGLRAG